MHVVYYLLPDQDNDSVVVSANVIDRESEVALMIDESDTTKSRFYVTYDAGEVLVAPASDDDRFYFSPFDNGFEACIPLNNENEARDIARFIQSKREALRDYQEQNS